MTPVRPPDRAQERAFLQAVVYAGLFEYPLTPAQLRETLIGATARDDDVVAWYRASERLQEAVEYGGGYFFPRGRRDLIAQRARREEVSRRLLDELSRPLALVVRMPFVRMVALSGSLAHLNAEADADLDLFVVTRARRVWMVALTTVLLTRLLGWRRRLCLNYIVSERAMWVAPADLFSANQIVHLRPVTGEAVYRRFLEANRFVTRFYPNFSPRPLVGLGPSIEAAVRGRANGACPAAARAAETMGRLVERVLDWTIAPLAEPVCRWSYRAYLLRRAHTWTSREQVRLEPECLKLHTSSHRREVMERFERALAETMAASDDDEAELSACPGRGHAAAIVPHANGLALAGTDARPGSTRDTRLPAVRTG